MLSRHSIFRTIRVPSLGGRPSKARRRFQIGTGFVDPCRRSIAATPVTVTARETLALRCAASPQLPRLPGVGDDLELSTAVVVAASTEDLFRRDTDRGDVSGGRGTTRPICPLFVVL